MDNYRKVYERTVTRLLADHAEQGIPADTDLWPAIHERLSRRAQPAGQPSSESSGVKWFDLLKQPAPPVPSSAPKTRLHPYLGAAVAGLALLVLVGISWLAISGLAQRRQEKIILSPPTAMATTPTSQPVSDTSPLFSIPVGKDGISYAGKISGFFAAAPDGTFWAGGSEPRLFHYSAEGKLLGTIDIPSYNGQPQDMVASGANLWLLYTSIDGPATVYKVAYDGHKLAEYEVPQYLQKRVSGLMLGEGGEVLLKGIFYNVSPAELTPGVPGPVPSVFPDTFPDPLWQLVDAQGNLSPRPLPGYTSGGKLYLARPAYPNAQTNRAFIKAGDVEFTAVLSHTLLSIDMLGVEPDGSFYVFVEEQDEGASPVVDLYKTIFHYASDGHLIERARVPMMSARLLTAPHGQFYSLVENPDRLQRGDAPPRSLDLYRLNFFSADQPLPPAPTSMPVPPPVPTTLPTAPEASPSPTALTAPDIETLIRKSDAIVDGWAFGSGQEGQDAYVSLQVQQWLKRPKDVGASGLQVFIPASMWASMPQSFKTNIDVTHRSRYIMFLAKGPSSPAYGQLYYLTGGPQGAFYVNGDRIQGSVPTQYDGTNVDDFERLITGEPAPGPTVPAEDTPTRAPNSPPVSLVREGDGFRLDVYEGTARFGLTPWIGPSRLMLEWSSATPGSNDFITYIVDTANGKLETLPSDIAANSLADAYAFPSPDGNRAVMMWQGSLLHIALYDFQSGSLQTIADLDPSVPQWASPETGLSELGPGTEVFVYGNVSWAGNDRFALTLTHSTQAGSQYDWDKALLVDTIQQQVSVPANRGSILAAFADGSVLLRSGRIDGEIQLFRPGGKSPATVAPSGPWTSGWSTSPDGKQVAWIEMTPPPGDWSKSLPNACCSGDPPPTVKDIAVWDSASGTIRRFDTPGFAWSSPDISWSESDRLRWSGDSSSLFYSAHPTQDHTTLYRLSLDGQSAPLVEIDKRVGLGVVAQGSDGSLYYMIRGMDCQNCAQLMRRYPDGKLEVVHANDVPMDWRVDEQGHLEMLRDGGVLVTDLTTGQSYQVNFPGERISSNGLGGSGMDTFVPLSPDGGWVAYAGSQSDAVPVGPDGPVDRGRTVHIARVK